MRRRLNERLGSALNRRVDKSVAAAMEAYVDGRLAPVWSWLEGLNARADETREVSAIARSDIDRLAPQVAALERRLEDLRAALIAARDGSEAILRDDAAQALIDEARAEHERARIRLEIAAHYEERLRRLESDRTTTKLSTPHS